MRDPEGEFRTRMATEGSHRNESLANGRVCTWNPRICTLIVLNRQLKVVYIGLRLLFARGKGAKLMDRNKSLAAGV